MNKILLFPDTPCEAFVFYFLHEEGPLSKPDIAEIYFKARAAFGACLSESHLICF